ncbi:MULTISPECIES: flagellin [Gracilimonas]|uniref:Flagellin n=1 Tax=Gracilimonas sediminicola TaxID=2952158 RepID=A0A9X2RHB0_9BACT|nr:flagellin [Gracilimonas sediminicola]MCP9293007.1 flagellin [Gracilimonas sediminicola]
MASFGDLNRVNTNVQSLDSQLSLNRVNRDLADSRMRMSTGLKINRAEDNAAGYSIATKLKSRTAGLEQSLQNVGDAKSVLDIAESSFDTIMDSLVEMKGLATQAANDTLGDTERGYIGDQIKALGDDINEIANQTVFQDFDLLNGATDDMSGSLDLTFQVGERASDTISTSIDAVNVGELFASGGDASLGATTTAGGGVAAGAGISATAATTSGQGALTFNASATSTDFRSFLSAVDSAIDEMSNRVNDIGITQSSLSVREETLSESISANESAKSRIMDTDFAKEQSKSVKLQILQQTATSSLAQANMGPQSVLGFLG